MKSARDMSGPVDAGAVAGASGPLGRVRSGATPVAGGVDVVVGRAYAGRVAGDVAAGDVAAGDVAAGVAGGTAEAAGAADGVGVRGGVAVVASVRAAGRDGSGVDMVWDVAWDVVGAGVADSAMDAGAGTPLAGGIGAEPTRGAESGARPKVAATRISSAREI
jgi:hypothetical protein